jgi:amino-acid N-acetyltransferase
MGIDAVQRGAARQPQALRHNRSTMNLVFPHTFVPWFRAVAPYIHAYRGKTFVVAMAGELIAAGKLNAFVQDLAILHAMGIKLVLVHGFGRR